MQHYALLCTGATGFVFPFEGELEWKTYPDPSNYQIVNKGMTWEEAEIYCEENGGHLAVIASDKEQIMIESLIRAQSEIKKQLLDRYAQRQ